VDNTPFGDKEEVVNIVRKLREDRKTFIPKKIQIRPRTKEGNVNTV